MVVLNWVACFRLAGRGRCFLLLPVENLPVRLNPPAELHLLCHSLLLHLRPQLEINSLTNRRKINTRIAEFYEKKSTFSTSLSFKLRDEFCWKFLSNRKINNSVLFKVRATRGRSGELRKLEERGKKRKKIIN